MRFLDEDEAEDEELNPIVSAVNLEDVFLVIIAASLIALAQNPLNVFSSDDVTVVKKDQIKTQTLAEFVNQEMRSRYFHPRWIEAMQDSGYAGATAILD